MIPLKNLILVFETFLKSKKTIIPNFKSVLESSYYTIIDDLAKNSKLLHNGDMLCNHILNKYFEEQINTQDEKNEIKIIEFQNDISLMSKKLTTFYNEGFIIIQQVVLPNATFLILKK